MMDEERPCWEFVRGITPGPPDPFCVQRMPTVEELWGLPREQRTLAIFDSGERPTTPAMKAVFRSCFGPGLGFYVCWAADHNLPVAQKFLQGPGLRDPLVWPDPDEIPIELLIVRRRPRIPRPKASPFQESLFDRLECGCLDACVGEHEKPASIDQLAKDRADLAAQLCQASLDYAPAQDAGSDPDYDVLAPER